MTAFSSEEAWPWADLFGYNADGVLQLVVELKPRVQRGALSMARHWLQDIGRHRPELHALFITPEYILLRLPAGRRLAQPHIALTRQLVETQLYERLGNEIDYAVSADASLDMAIDTKRVPLQKLDPLGLQRVVESWLDSCLAMPAEKLQRLPAQEWIVSSGLHQALWHGRISSSVGGATAYAFAG